MHTIGNRVQVAECSGIDSRKIGTVIAWGDVPMRQTSGGIIPDLTGHYKPADKRRETPIRTNAGEIIVMFNDRLRLV